MSPIVFFFFKIASAILGLLYFHAHFRIVCSNFYGKCWYFDRDHIKSIDSLGSIDILTIFVLPIHKHGMCFHFFVSYSTSFINVLWFSKNRSFTSLIKFIPRYFILFGAIVNGIVFLISLSVASFLVYGNATDFCALILYPVTLLNLFISSGIFLVEFLGVSIYIVSCYLQIGKI